MTAAAYYFAPYESIHPRLRGAGSEANGTFLVGPEKALEPA
jgi:hypothetical protein